jgi:hypothetical protein
MGIAFYSNGYSLRRAIVRTLESLGYKDITLLANKVSECDGTENNYELFIIGLDENKIDAMKCVTYLRADKDSGKPILFYGYEALESLERNPGSSILQIPGIDYVRLPFVIPELSRAVQKALSQIGIKAGIDRQARADIALTKMRIFKHDLKNAVSTVEIIYKLKRSGSVSIIEKNWNTVKNSLFEAEDLMRKNSAYLEEIRIQITEALSREQLTGVKKKLGDAENRFGMLIKSLSEYNDENRKSVILNAEMTIESLNQIIAILESVKA